MDNEEYREVIKRLNLEAMTNKEIQDAVLAYDAVLKSTVDVFGEVLDNSVIIAAIQAGSYIAWRGIMGPKQLEDSRHQMYPRVHV